MIQRHSCPVCTAPKVSLVTDYEQGEDRTEAYDYEGQENEHVQTFCSGCGTFFMNPSEARLRGYP